MLSIQQMRETLGHKYDHLTDEQVLGIERTLRILANDVIDRVVKMTPEERRAFDRKVKTKR
jgi:hypothetical protein